MSMLVAAGSKETPPPAVQKQCSGWGLLITSSHHHLNHAKSISCLVNFTSWFPAVSPLNFHGAHLEWCTTLKGCLERRSYSVCTHACIYVNGDKRARGWCGLSTLWNSYTCGMSVRTDTAPKGHCSLTPSSKSAAKEHRFGCYSKSELQDTFVLPKSTDHSQEINVFVKSSTILDKNHKLSQVISVAPSLDAKNVQVPLGGNVVPQAYE